MFQLQFALLKSIKKFVNHFNFHRTMFCCLLNGFDEACVCVCLLCMEISEFVRIRAAIKFGFLFIDETRYTKKVNIELCSRARIQFQPATPFTYEWKFEILLLFTFAHTAVATTNNNNTIDLINIFMVVSS